MKENNDSKKAIIFLVFVLLIMATILLRKYVFEGYYLFNDDKLSDIIRANVPAYTHMYDAISQGGFFWSWQMGIGTSMFSHADVYLDPFVYITFIFGRSHITRMMLYMYIAKIVASGCAFYAYVSYLKLDKNATICSSVFYSFCGYSIIMGSNFALGTILVYLPLVLLGAEKYINEGKKVLLFVSLFLIAILSYYYFYITAFCLILYVLYKLVFEKNVSLKKILGFFVIGVLSVTCAAFILLPQIELVLNSPRTGASTDIQAGKNLLIPSFSTLFTAIIRSFSNDALGNSYENFHRGYSYIGVDYFSQCTFVSSFFVYFLMVYFYKEPKEKKWKKAVPIIVLGLFFCLPIVPYFFNAFSTINARWTFFASFLQCVLCAQAIDKLKKNDNFFIWELYIASFIISIGLMFVGILFIAKKHPQYQYNHILSEMCNTLGPSIKWMFIIYILTPIIIYIVKKVLLKKKGKNSLVIAISLVVLFDMCHNYYYWYQSKYSVTEYSEENNICYNDNSARIIYDILPQLDDFYRINKSFDSVVEKNGIPSENDAMIQGYYGLKNYNSLGNPAYISFLQNAGCYCTVPQNISYYTENGIKPQDIVGQELNYINGVEQRYSLMSYLGVRYYLSKNIDEIVPDYFELISVDNDIYIYEIKYFMPMVFCNYLSVSEEKYLKMSNEEKDIALLSATILQDNVVNDKLPRLDEALCATIEKRNQFKLTSFDNDVVKGEIEVLEGGQYLSTTIPYDKNWNIYVDGNKVETMKVNTGFVGCKINPGKHTVMFEYKPVSFYLGCAISGFSFFIILIWVIIDKTKKQRTNKSFSF